MQNEINGFVCKMYENIVKKGENAGCQHFLLFAQCFQVVFFVNIIKFCHRMVKVHVQETQLESICRKENCFP